MIASPNAVICCGALIRPAPRHVFTTQFPLVWLVCACESAWLGSYFRETDGCSWRKEEEGHWGLRFLLPVEILGILFSEHDYLFFLPSLRPPSFLPSPFCPPLSNHSLPPPSCKPSLSSKLTSYPRMTLNFWSCCLTSLVHKLLCLVFLSAGGETLNFTHDKQTLYQLIPYSPSSQHVLLRRRQEYKALLMCSYFKAFGRTSYF